MFKVSYTGKFLVNFQINQFYRRSIHIETTQLIYAED